jgi:Ca-activated chloride channel homolog
MLFEYVQQLVFKHPYFLGLLFLLPLLAVWYFLFQKKQQAYFQVSTTNTFINSTTLKNLSIHIPFFCRLLTLTFFIVALARPQIKNSITSTEGEGIDIILCMDVSGSMAAQDFLPNRMEAAKKQAIDFVNNRLTDRIGIVIFAEESFTLCPLTTDKKAIITAIESIKIGLLSNGTSIGDGLATSVQRLKQSSIKSKIIVLLTDGVNNGGIMGTDNATEIAKVLQTKVYTIGLGTNGLAPYTENTAAGPVTTYEKVAIDEKLLQHIADETGGKYFRATNNNGLEIIYKEIDGLEKSKVTINTTVRFTEKFFPFVLMGLLFLCMDIIVKYVVLKKFP